MAASGLDSSAIKPGMKVHVARFYGAGAEHPQLRVISTHIVRPGESLASIIGDYAHDAVPASVPRRTPVILAAIGCNQDSSWQSAHGALLLSTDIPFSLSVPT